MIRIKTIGTYIWALLLSTACNSQENKSKAYIDHKDGITNSAPKGAWKVNREYDEAGNLIRYDSVYSWSSGTDLDHLATLDRDSILKSMQANLYKKFSNFDFGREGFGDFFSNDSLFIKPFFHDDFFESDFGKDIMDIQKIQERMEAMQKQFIERYGQRKAPKKEEYREN